MLIKTDVLNPYKGEAVNVKEAVEEALRISSLGYSTQQERIENHTDKLSDMFGRLLVFLNHKEHISEQEIVLILATHTITTEQSN